MLDCYYLDPTLFIESYSSPMSTRSAADMVGGLSSGDEEGYHTAPNGSNSRIDTIGSARSLLGEFSDGDLADHYHITRLGRSILGKDRTMYWRHQTNSPMDLITELIKEQAWAKGQGRNPASY